MNQTMQPTLQFRPLSPAVAADAPSALDLLITITTPDPPAAETSQQRPALNLALVIDRSGSMSGSKLSYARKAARFLAAELSSRDRLAIITFDDEVQVLVPSTPVTDPQPFIAAINTIHSGGCTALFDGWVAGATEVANHLDPAALNRVLLLSDGGANHGIFDAEEIATHVEGLSQRGVSTSAFGLGNGFDEDLMGAVASAGDGSLAFIESPQQLADLYASELHGLASTLGKRVSLGIRSKNGAELVDVLNDLSSTAYGNLKLSNLRAGRELHLAVRLQLPAWQPNQEICSIRLAWDAPGSSDRQTLIEQLILPVIKATALQALEIDPLVAEQFALLQANRDRRRAIELLDQGDLAAASSSLDAIDGNLSALPNSQLICKERTLIAEKKELLHRNRNLSRKRMRSESLRSSLDVWDGESSSKG
ncbi:MAG: VWA domain-containing protein [Prochlorococcus sp.]